MKFQTRISLAVLALTVVLAAGLAIIGEFTGKRLNFFSYQLAGLRFSGVGHQSTGMAVTDS